SRVAVMAFEPSESNLPQLAAFPALIDNIVAWSQRLAPQSVAAGSPFALTEPAGTTAASLAPAAGGTPRKLKVTAGGEVPVALFDPTVGTKPPPTTLVLDRSLSIGATAGEAESEWLAANRGCGDGCRVVQFGGGAEFTGEGADLLPQATGGGVESGESNLQA